MTNLITLLVQTKTQATIEILLLLVGAAIIGYVTAWLYYKSLYAKRIDTYKSEIADLKKKIKDLETDNQNLKKNVKSKDDEIIYLNKKIKALEALHAEAVDETDDMKQQNKKNEQLLYEKDEALAIIAKRKQKIDYKSFGTATELEMDDLRMISGIGPFIEERLHDIDIYTYKQISKFTKNDIVIINDAIEYFAGRIERDEWVEQAKELVLETEKRDALFKRISERKSSIYYNRIGTATENEADDLTIISGIGGWIGKKLNILDIYTYRQISNFNDEDVQSVTDAIEYFPGRIERDEWIDQAKELVRIAGKKADLLKSISDNKSRIYFDRLGIAHKHHANNLTLIKGISLWIEERLNMLEIYTFEQISKLDPKDVETISEILEIPKDRIKKDDWIGQAKELVKK